ncbi:MAG: ferrous iron transport protein A [Deltaproteobacteria bacterium]|nr:ferrous iron transport protein A [Deltaproteobacteria bacterium]
MIKSQRSDAISFPLRMAGEGENVKIMSLRGGRSFHDRLSGMGLNVGSEVEVVRNQDNGPVLVAHEGIRLFLGGGMAEKIHVMVVDKERGRNNFPK